ncbi:MAG: 1-deoxy-D-xylulose-5-phosphate reductoisomerase [Succinivibrionaceae bacterium]
MNNITILGATGSIGASTLDVISRNPEKYKLFAATGNKNVEKMLNIVRNFSPNVVVMSDQKAYLNLKNRINEEHLKTDVLCGEEAMCAVVASSETDSVMSAIVGSAGLKPTLSAINSGKTIYLANKESLVMTGHIFIETAHRYKSRIIPVDSEHNAIFQCLPESEQKNIGYCNLKTAGISHILLTGSGGPFRDRDLKTFDSITPDEAISHPNWSMGRKISVDSATMMNKGLEFIEAKWLFNAKPDDIQVVVHPESVIHSMVQYIDGAVLAQMGAPDMRTPIARAMSWPDRIECGVEPLNFSSMKNLSFREIDYHRYPCLKLAIDACYTSQSLTTAINAANEIAVNSFLDGKIKFTDIYTINSRVADIFVNKESYDLESILDIDIQARVAAYNELVRL